MDRHHHTDQQHCPGFTYRLGTLVVCMHCFKTLGTDSTATPKKILLAKHTCVESLLSKQPAAPPPYN